MKGQLTIEYLVSFSIFIGLITYIYFLYSANIPGFIEEVKKEDTRAKTYQLSEILVNDPGEPIDWYKWSKNDIQRIGLSDENFNKTNLVSEAKINRFKNEFDCNDLVDYKYVKENLFALDKDFSIIIFEIDQSNGMRTKLFSCSPHTVFKTSILSKLTRITAYYDEDGGMKLAEIIVQMW